MSSFFIIASIIVRFSLRMEATSPANFAWLWSLVSSSLAFFFCHASVPLEPLLALLLPCLALFSFGGPCEARAAGVVPWSLPLKCGVQRPCRQALHPAASLPPHLRWSFPPWPLLRHGLGTAGLHPAADERGCHCLHCCLGRCPLEFGTKRVQLLLGVKAGYLPAPFRLGRCWVGDAGPIVRQQVTTV